jgi:tetrapyrrole methylase family protein / MazG family protein
MGIVVVGLGPGPYRALTLEAAEALAAAGELYLRTRIHPTVDEFPPTLRWQSFDELYERADDFEALYDQIADVLLERGARGDVTYAVPGHPLVGEATVQRLLARAPAAGVTVRVIGGLSFAEAALTASGTVVADHLQIVDALALPPLAPTVPLLVYQVYKATVASDVKLALLRLYPPEHPVLVVQGAATPHERVERVALSALDHGRSFDHLTTLFVPPLPPDEDFGTMPGLAHLVARLRRPGGCPWDAQQTHLSLKRYLMEEAYEAAEAIEEADDAAFCDELGDVLLQVVLHAEMADERGAFDVTDVLRSICAKLVRRHPHVFGSTVVADAQEVELNWEAIKRRERGDAAPASLFDGLPRHLPALITAQAIQKRLGGIGATWDSREAAIDWARGQLDTLAGADEASRDAALGNLLLALAQVARLQRGDAEELLQAANRRVVRHVRQLEAAGQLNAAGLSSAGEAAGRSSGLLAPAALHELST